MALPSIPTVTERYDRVVVDINGKINQGTPSLPLSFVKLLAKAIAGVSYLCDFAILWVYKQIFPSTAAYDTLRNMGSIVGLTPDAAVAAVLLCTIPGTTGQWVYIGELFIGPNGVVYKVTADTEIILGEATNVPLLALTSGEIGNLEVGEILDIQQTNLYLDGTAEVTSVQTTGSEEETEESFKSLVVARYKRRITGGSPFDYYLWGLETPNFDWIGVYAKPGYPSTILIYGHVDNQTDGIPTAGQLDDLEEYLTYDPVTGKEHRKPLNDTLEIAAIDNEEYNITFDIVNSTAAIKTAIEDAIETYIASLRPFIDGISDIHSEILSNSNLMAIANDVAADSDAFVSACEIERDSDSQVEDYFELTGGTLAKLGTMSWTEL